MKRNGCLVAGALGASAGTGLGLLYARYRRESQLASARLLAGSQMAATQLGPVEYALEGDGPPALVVHGGGGGYDQGLLFARFLGLSSGFRCLAA